MEPNNLSHERLAHSTCNEEARPMLADMEIKITIPKGKKWGLS